MGFTYNGTEVQGVTYNGSTVETITYNGVTVWENVKPLEQESWARIKEIAQAGKAAKYFKVGDTKTIPNFPDVDFTAAVSTLTAVIIGINHNASVEGNNKIHFALTAGKNGNTLNVMPVKNAAGNNSRTTAGGWGSSYLRSNLRAQLQYFPTDLKNAIGTVTKWTDNAGGTSNTASALTENLFYLSAKEVFGTIGYADEERIGPNEAAKQQQYDFWKNMIGAVTNTYNTRTKLFSTDMYTRSPAYKSNDKWVDIVSTNYSYVSIMYAESTGHVIPCFVVG